MKKLLVMLLVLGMASLAHATMVFPTFPDADAVVEVVSASHTTETALEGVGTGDVVTIQVNLVDNDLVTNAGGYSSYDGYALSSMDLHLTVTGPGTLATSSAKGLLHNGKFGAWGQSNPLITANALWASGTGPTGDSILAGGMFPADPDLPKLLWNIQVSVDAAYDGTVPIDVDLNLRGTTSYADGPLSISGTTDGYGHLMPDFGDWTIATENDLGDLRIGIPEPMTMALLGLGGLGLIRRRRR